MKTTIRPLVLPIYVYKHDTSVQFGGAHGVMVIGNGHGDMSSNPGWG